MANSDAKAVVKDFFETINAGRLNALEKCLSPDFVNHDPLPAEQAGRLGVPQALRKMKEAFPDFHIDLDQVIAEGDRVVVQLRAKGTQRGEYLGQAPTNQPMTWAGIAIFRVKDGKLAERWATVVPSGATQPAGGPSITMMPDSESKKPVS